MHWVVTKMKLTLKTNQLFIKLPLNSTYVAIQLLKNRLQSWFDWNCQNGDQRKNFRINILQAALGASSKPIEGCELWNCLIVHWGRLVDRPCLSDTSCPFPFAAFIREKGKKEGTNANVYYFRKENCSKNIIWVCKNCYAIPSSLKLRGCRSLPKLTLLSC